MMKTAPRTTNVRDAALRRLGRLNRWLIAGSVALTGIFTEVAASAFPGRTIKASAASRSSTRSQRLEHSGDDGSAATTEPVQPPEQAPQSSPTEGSASSQETPSQSAPSQSSPSQQTTPAQEPTPTSEPTTPSQSAAPAEEPSRTTEPAPTQETAPAPARETAPPVVSGGS